MTSPAVPSGPAGPGARPTQSSRSVWLERGLWAVACVVLLRLIWPNSDSPLIGKPAARLSLPSLSSGHAVSLMPQNGKPLLIEVFASWCSACKRSSSMLGSLGQAAREGTLNVVAVSVDDSAEDALGAVRDWPIQVPVLHDRRAALRRAYGVRVLPTFILIDAQGRVSDVTAGVPGALDLRRWLNAKDR